MGEAIKAAKWPPWAISAVLLLGGGYGARVAFVKELQEQETRCLQAVTAADTRNAERFATKEEVSEKLREVERELRAVYVEARNNR